ncbi:hypothetical protein [Ectobacillus panaciterrae]|uniref:hypothetical protein n=1 Tax=Ectobacillus panaciterrae TaxID=363872 RepID=UPI0012DE41EB|nr:hypothetical protein [Ectobacillus panaciterrae]
MKANDTAPNDMIVKFANRKVTFEFALHGNRRERDTRRSHDDTGGFFNPTASNSSTSVACSIADLCMLSARGSVKPNVCAFLLKSSLLL